MTETVEDAQCRELMELVQSRMTARVDKMKVTFQGAIDPDEWPPKAQEVGSKEC